MRKLYEVCGIIDYGDSKIVSEMFTFIVQAESLDEACRYMRETESLKIISAKLSDVRTFVVVPEGWK